jgi:hypothetical protein
MDRCEEVDERQVSFIVQEFQPEFFVRAEFFWFNINRVGQSCQGLHANRGVKKYKLLDFETSFKT